MAFFLPSSGFVILFSSAEEEKREQYPLALSKLIDLQAEFPLQVSIQSVRL